MFTRIKSISSYVTSGTWRQTGYTSSLIDGGRTYSITVGGKYTLNSITTGHNVNVEFHCTSTGGIS